MRIGNSRKWKKEKKENKGMWDHTKNPKWSTVTLIESQSIIQTQFFLIFVSFFAWNWLKWGKKYEIVNEKQTNTKKNAGKRENNTNQKLTNRKSKRRRKIKK